MRVVIQRVTQGMVEVDARNIGEIGNGYVVLLGVHKDDEERDAVYLAEKTAMLRIFEDENGRLNRSIIEVEGSILSISQFTLYADYKKGRRPSFTEAADVNKAKFLYNVYNLKLREFGISVKEGKFQSMMRVSIINDGPVTIVMDSR
jgi:D-tyrosyl-tRNA(Tyr) deacylase